MSFRRYVLANILVASSVLAVVICDGKEASKATSFDIASAATAVIGQDKSDPCPNALTQPEINLCALAHFKRADEKLNAVYKRIISGLRSIDRSNLIAAQRAWLKYRDTDCKAAALFHGGSMAPTVEANCLEDLTDDRTKELIKIYESEEDR